MEDFNCKKEFCCQTKKSENNELEGVTWNHVRFGSERSAQNTRFLLCATSLILSTRCLV